MTAQFARQLHLGRKISIQTGSRRILFLSPDEILWIEANNSKTLFHTTASNYLAHETISKLEEYLDPQYFSRINRSVIVNIDQIRELHPWFHGDTRVILTDGTILIWSRVYATRLRQILSLQS